MQRVAMATAFTGLLLGGQVLLTPPDMAAGPRASVLASASTDPTKSGVLLEPWRGLRLLERPRQVLRWDTESELPLLVRCAVVPPALSVAVDHQPVQDAVGHRDDGLLVAAALDQAAVLGGEVGVAFAGRAPGALDQGLPQAAVGKPGAAAQALAGTLVVAGAEVRPGRGMAGGGKATHVAAEFGEDGLGRPARDARNGVEPGSASPSAAVSVAMWRSQVAMASSRNRWCSTRFERSATASTSVRRGDRRDVTAARCSELREARARAVDRGRCQARHRVRGAHHPLHPSFRVSTNRV
jgi:hypothetical protein